MAIIGVDIGGPYNCRAFIAKDDELVIYTFDPLPVVRKYTKEKALEKASELAENSWNYKVALVSEDAASFYQKKLQIMVKGVLTAFYDLVTRKVKRNPDLYLKDSCSLSWSILSPSWVRVVLFVGYHVVTLYGETLRKYNIPRENVRERRQELEVMEVNCERIKQIVGLILAGKFNSPYPQKRNVPRSPHTGYMSLPSGFEAYIRHFDGSIEVFKATPFPIYKRLSAHEGEKYLQSVENRGSYFSIAVLEPNEVPLVRQAYAQAIFRLVNRIKDETRRLLEDFEGTKWTSESIHILATELARKYVTVLKLEQLKVKHELKLALNNLPWDNPDSEFITVFALLPLSNEDILESAQEYLKWILLQNEKLDSVG